MKQINLTLAKSGDVAVLRNETQRDIIEVSNNDISTKPFFTAVLKGFCFNLHL